MTGTPKGVSDSGASTGDGVAKQATGASALKVSATELTGVSPSRQTTTADTDVNVTVNVEYEPKADLTHGRTGRKMIPGLRAFAGEERAAAKKARASWRIFTIMAEFIEATGRLSKIRPAVSIRGSMRLREDSPYYERIIEIARLFLDVGSAIIPDGGPGIMEVANKGVHASKSVSVGLDTELSHER